MNRDEYDKLDRMNASTIVQAYDGIEGGVIRTNMRRLRKAMEGERRATDGMIFGIQYHSFILDDPDDFDERFKIVPDFKRQEGNVDAKGKPSTNGNTNWVQNKKREFFEECEDAGVYLLDKDSDRRINQRKLERCQGISDGLRENPVARRLIDDCEREVTLQGEIDGVQFKGRLDLVAKNNRGFADLKGCPSAVDFVFGKAQCNQNVDIKLAVYRELMRQNYYETPTEIDLIAIESDGAFDCVVYRVPDDLIDFGFLKLQVLLSDYRHALKTGQWPGGQYGSTEPLPMFVPNYAMPDEDVMIEIQQMMEGRKA